MALWYKIFHGSVENTTVKSANYHPIGFTWHWTIEDQLDDSNYTWRIFDCYDCSLENGWKTSDSSGSPVETETNNMWESPGDE